MASTRSRRSALVAGLVAATLLSILALSGNLVGGLKTTGRVIVSPFTWTISAIAHPIANVFAGAVNYSDVLHQNQQLRAELGRARTQANESRALRRQLAELSTAANVPYIGTMHAVIAPVTTNSPTNFSASFTIAKGANDGLLVGMPVLANGGLVGRVIVTTAHTSTVLMITDQTSLVGCTFGSGGTDVLVYGRGVNDPLSVSAVPLNSPLAPGTIFSTNGLQGGLYPPGLPVARVRTVTLTPGSATYDLSLSPTADLNHLYYVDVLFWEPST